MEADRPVGRGRGIRRAMPTVGKPTDHVEELMGVVVRNLETASLSDPASSGPKAKDEGPGLGFRGTSRGARVASGRWDGNTKPESCKEKRGSTGTEVNLVSNFFPLKQVTAWTLYQYEVQFEPDVLIRRYRKAIVLTRIPGCLYNGYNTLYACGPVNDNDMDFEHIDKNDSTKIVKVHLKMVQQIKPGDSTYVHLYDEILRQMLKSLALQDQNGTYFDMADPTEIQQHKMLLFPGFKAAIKSHEEVVLLNLDPRTKVVRTEDMNSYMKDLKNNIRFGSDQEKKNKVEEKIKGSVIITRYNNKTYKIDKINWELNPRSTFPTKAGQLTYVQYFKDKYKLSITDMSQPLLLAAPDKRKFHQLKEGEELPDIYLVPELCNPTGLTEEQRANFTLMKDLNQHLHQTPTEKTKRLQKFMKRVQESPTLQQFMDNWSYKFDSELLRLKGRELPNEKIVFKNGKDFEVKTKGDFGTAFRSEKMISCKDLKNWVLIVTDRDQTGVKDLISSMKKVAAPLGMNVSDPNIKTIKDNRKDTYINAISDAMKKGSWDLVMVILANNNVDTYAAVKHKLSVLEAQPSQCFLSKNLKNKGLMSIATQVIIQINAKLGGEPWGVKIPVKGLMVVGFDAYKGGKAGPGKSVGALVSTTKGETYSTYFSTVSIHDSGDELCRNICADFTRCLQAYKSVNGNYPEMIIFFRDGVGDGQLQYVAKIEVDRVVAAIQECLHPKLAPEEAPLPKFAYIVTTKGSSSKFFKRDGNENPVPGTIVDSVITFPERYDFYLVPQAVRQGSVSPTSFNVIYDTTGLPADRMQRLTYKLCHMYYNYTGTVSVPAPVQYAHKLALQTGIAQGGPSNEELSHYLHFL